MTTIRKKGAEFSELVIPKNCSPAQKTDMMLSFYCGAFTVLRLQLVELSELEDDKAVEALKSLHDELVEILGKYVKL